MKSIEHVTRKIIKETNINLKQVNEVMDFFQKKIVNVIRNPGDINGIYINKIGTFCIDRYKLKNHLKMLIYKMRCLKSKQTNKADVSYQNYALEFKRLWKLWKRIQTEKKN